MKVLAWVVLVAFFGGFLGGLSWLAYSADRSWKDVGVLWALWLGAFGAVAAAAWAGPVIAS